MASEKQRQAARKTIAGARGKQTLKRLPKKTRTALGKEGAKAAKRARRRR